MSRVMVTCVVREGWARRRRGRNLAAMVTAGTFKLETEYSIWDAILGQRGMRVLRGMSSVYMTLPQAAPYSKLPLKSAQSVLVASEIYSYHPASSRRWLTR